MEEDKTSYEYIFQNIEEVTKNILEPYGRDPKHFETQNADDLKIILQMQKLSMSMMMSMTDAIAEEEQGEPIFFSPEHASLQEQVLYQQDKAEILERIHRSQENSEMNQQELAEMRENFMEALQQQQEEVDRLNKKLEKAQAKAKDEEKARKQAEKETEKERKARKKAENKLSTASFSPLDILSHNNTKLANNLFDGNIQLNQLTYLDVLKSNKNRKEEELTISCTLSSELFDTGNVEFSSQPLTPYDREIYDAISSHYQAGNCQLTVAEIYRAMTGKVKGSNHKPSAQQADAITKSIQRIGKLRVKIDCTNELLARGVDISHSKLDSIALDYRTLEGESSNGKGFTIYVIQSEPVLYSYAKSVKQIIPIPMKYLDTPTNNSEDLLVLKKYLLSRIMNMTSLHNSISQNTILLEHIYQQAKADNNNLKRKVRNKMEPFFAYWSTLGLFTKFEYLSKGKELHAVKFFFPSQKKIKSSTKK